MSDRRDNADRILELLTQMREIRAAMEVKRGELSKARSEEYRLEGELSKIRKANEALADELQWRNDDLEDLQKGVDALVEASQSESDA